MNSAATQPCQAITKAGQPCKNSARPDSAFCYVHRNQEVVQVEAEAEPAPADRAGISGRPEFRAVVAELNELADELRKLIPAYSAPPFSPEGLLRLLRDNIDRMTPEMRLGLLRDLQSNLEGASPRDFFDPETWKGLWYLLNYSLQNEAVVIREKLAGRLANIPGASALADMQGMLQGASPRDLLVLETWKGMWYMLNYTVQSQVEEVRRRVRGEEAEA